MINKLSKQKTPGSLLPINVDKPQKAFECVCIDFIVGLPFSRGFDSIMVVINKFTRFGIFIPTNSNYTAISTADLFVKHVVCGGGWLPSKFITDCDTKFLAEFWQGVMEALKIKHRPSTAYHAQSDGATERLNQIIEIMLRAYTSPLQDDWVMFLPMVALAYNMACNVSTSKTPVEMLYIQPHDVLKRLLQPQEIDNKNGQKETIEVWLEQVKIRISDAQEAIRFAAALQKWYYDSKHGTLPDYKVGDYVSVRLDKHPSFVRHNKLSQQKLPPCKIMEIL